MKPVVAVVSPGAMGSAVAHCLTVNGIEVRTSLTGRSEATQARARAAGMTATTDDGVAAADIILSILPPGEALALAQRLSPALRQSPGRPIYVDCNAVNPDTVGRIAAVIEASGCPFVDGGIIGGPPKPGTRATKIFLSGPEAECVAVLEQYGLVMPVLPGPVGVASAMKMSYAGITKGFTALGAMMMLAATRGGTAEYLRRELEASQPQLLAWLTRATPNMFSKAHRWVAEMQEIAGFTGEDAAARQLFDAAARFYARIAEDHASGQQETDALAAFCR